MIYWYHRARWVQPMCPPISTTSSLKSSRTLWEQLVKQLRSGRSMNYLALGTVSSLLGSYCFVEDEDFYEGLFQLPNIQDKRWHHNKDLGQRGWYEQTREEENFQLHVQHCPKGEEKRTIFNPHVLIFQATFPRWFCPVRGVPMEGVLLQPSCPCTDWVMVCRCQGFMQGYNSEYFLLEWVLFSIDQRRCVTLCPFHHPSLIKSTFGHVFIIAVKTMVASFVFNLHIQVLYGWYQIG